MNKKYQKKWIVILVVLLLIVSNVATFVFSNLITIAIGDKVVIQARDAHTADFIHKFLYLKNQIRDSYYQELDEDILMEGALKGLFEAVGDPYTMYYDREQFQSYVEQMENSYVGIGVVVSMDEDDRVTVVSPIEGSPGQKAGLMPGDKILQVDGADISGLSLEEVVGLIKGEEGTEVTLTILKKTDENIVEKVLVREEIIMTSVDSQVIDGIGYISINQFEPYTYDEFEKQLSELLEQNVQGMVFDLRDNPGGMMDSVVAVLDEIMGESVIVYTEDRQGNREYERSTDRDQLDMPIAVLINEGSASASEIFAGALQDTGEAVIIGTTSFGKGIVQRMSDLQDGTGYKITVSEYFTPNGRNIQGIGIVPDIEVEIDEEFYYGTDYTMEEDPQLQRALEELNKEVEAITL
ncbi:S41 family peptidase [Alkalibacter rhizosphaerae]|uniref:S41 family peptidase n=1 Tax=Alkalibacter rhizosphaerae TaxID=2815577 RepID=A0A974XLF8_9FIRM|nr:S41 family peptidase [Alkalibacter rhizosphaerae]QSX08131.1 S41 family peptidase [Alkalibacter rhizosphaerae]